MGSETRARIALGALLLATVVAFSQLFDNGAFFGPALVAVILATAVAIVARRLGAGSVLGAGISAAALLWYLAVVFEGRHLFYGLPTPEAASRLAQAVLRARGASQIDFAPVPARPGYVIMLVVGMWVAATVAETATFRWRRPLLASLAPIALLSLVLITGSGTASTLMIVLFLAALLSFWGLESSHRLRSWGRWVSPWAHHSEEPQSVTGAVARRMGASCLAAAVVAPLLLPALDEGLLAWRSGIGRGGNLGSAGSVNLLVSLAPRLVEQSDEELFRVLADRPTYWRLTSLADFDGQDWERSDDNFIPLAGGSVQTYQEPATETTTVTQRFTITGLADDLLPAAVEPAIVTLGETEGRGPDDIGVDPDTGELRLDGGLLEDMRYTVQSDVPDASYEALNQAAVGDPGPLYKELPSDLSDSVFELRDRWTADLDTPLQKLVAIQDRLREFEYSLDVRPEDSADYLTAFLTKTRAGYCQQFATAFAVLARSLGFPARVSVGFLPGTPAPDGNTLIVTGNHAHAWPEVYFEGFGWVPFEPTPRSEANEPPYTLASFATGGEGTGEIGGPGGGPAGGDGILANRFQDAGTGIRERTGGSLPGAVTAPLRRDPAWAKAFNRLAWGALGLGLVFLVTVPLLKEWRVRRRYRNARGPVDEAGAAFVQFERDAAELAAARRASESAVAYALRIAAANRAPKRAAVGLATLYEAAEYGGTGISGRQAAEAKRLAGQLRGALWASASWWERTVRLFSPASLAPGPRTSGAARASLAATLVKATRSG